MSEYKESVLIICEAGWRDVRELSLELERKGISSTVLIKGDPGRGVKSFITKHPLTRNRFFPRLVFRVRLPSYLIFLRIVRKAKVCVWTNLRSEGLLRPYAKLCGIKLIRFIEEGNKSSVDEMRGNVQSMCSRIVELLK